jgi:LL-diaminopimelate aminotransferase
VVLVPDPGYAVYANAASFAGANVVTMPLLEQNNFLPDLSAIPANIRQQAKLLWVNYPNNPTGAVASEAFFNELIEFAHTHQIMVCHDAPYLHVTYDGYCAPSLLPVPGAQEVTVEFNSLSKTYNMAGWRLGMACGHTKAIAALHSLKSNLDSSQFLVVQDAGIAALTGDQSWLDERNAIYQVRRDIVLDGLSQASLIAHKPQAAMYVWSRIPEGRQSGEFTRMLLKETGVSVTPGSFFGTCGEGYFRISLSTPTPRVEEAMTRILAWI